MDYQALNYNELRKVCKYIGFEIKWKGKGIKEKGIIKKITIKDKFCKLKINQEIIIVSKIYFRPNDVNYLKGNSLKAKKKLNWKPKNGLNSLIKEMVDNDTIKLASSLGNAQGGTSIDFTSTGVGNFTLFKAAVQGDGYYMASGGAGAGSYEVVNSIPVPVFRKFSSSSVIGSFPAPFRATSIFPMLSCSLFALYRAFIARLDSFFALAFALDNFVDIDLRAYFAISSL